MHHYFSLNEVEANPFSRRSSSLFSRSDYFREVLNCKDDSIQCVVISTYRLHLQYFQESFRELFEAKPSIPTVILHGEKKKIFSDNPTSYVGNTAKRYAKYGKNVKTVQEVDYATDEEPCDLSTRQLREAIEIPYGNIIIAEVFPQYMSNDPLKSKSIAGVHHPKYMLLFTQRGLHVTISTGNYSEPSTIDLSWCQFFKRRATGAHCTESAANDNLPKNDFGIILEDFLSKQSEQIRSDENIYPSEWLNTASNTLNFMKWLTIHACLRTALSKEFDFDSAEVDLVTVFPGREELPLPSEEERRELFRRQNLDSDLIKFNRCQRCEIDALRLGSASGNIKYGSNRIKELLTRKEPQLRRTLTPADVLVMQPTSIGVGINNQYIASLLGKYMPESGWDEEDWGLLRQECWRLIWPTSSFVTSQAQRMIKRSRSSVLPSPVLSVETLDRSSSNSTVSEVRLSEVNILKRKVDIADAGDLNRDSGSDDEGDITGGAYFLHPRSFYMMEPDIHSQFHVYKPNLSLKKCDKEDPDNENINKLLSTYCPHNKLYCRLLASDGDAAEYLGSREDTETEKQADRGCLCYDLAWCLMTSACLSRGAQGEDFHHSICVDCRYLKKGYTQFKNFELGVLFHSRPGRQYRALNGLCQIHNHAVASSPDENGVIVLPVPFEMFSCSPYCSMDGALTKRPYFNPDKEAIKFEKSQSIS